MYYVWKYGLGLLFSPADLFMENKPEKQDKFKENQ
jgi:hypothetical protein